MLGGSSYQCTALRLDIHRKNYKLALCHGKHFLSIWHIRHYSQSLLRKRVVDRLHSNYVFLYRSRFYLWYVFLFLLHLRNLIWSHNWMLQVSLRHQRKIQNCKSFHQDNLNRNRCIPIMQQPIQELILKGYPSSIVFVY